jgi:hypothetical protein
MTIFKKAQTSRPIIAMKIRDKVNLIAIQRALPFSGGLRNLIRDKLIAHNGQTYYLTDKGTKTLKRISRIERNIRAKLREGRTRGE